MPDAPAANSGALTVAFDRLTIGDMEDFEEITGKPMMSTMEDLARIDIASIPVKILKALVFLVKRMDDPEFTIEAARKVKVTELVLDFGAEPDPTDAAG